MKKIIFVTLIFSGIILGAAYAEEANPIVVTQMQGDVKLIREGAEMPVAVGTACQAKDTLRTSETCKVDVAFNGTTGTRLLPNSEMKILQTNPKETMIAIQQGNALFNLKKLADGSTFRVETPTAIAAVRGTRFWGRVDGENAGNLTTSFAVLEGSVDIFAKSVNRTYHLEKNQALDIPAQVENSPSVREAKREEIKAMKQTSDIATGVAE